MYQEWRAKERHRYVQDFPSVVGRKPKDYEVFSISNRGYTYLAKEADILLGSRLIDLANLTTTGFIKEIHCICMNRKMDETDLDLFIEEVLFLKPEWRGLPVRTKVRTPLMGSDRSQRFQQLIQQ